MAIDLEKFLKAKRFTTDHTLDDATDQVLVKTTAGSSVGDAIATAIAGVTIPDATDTVKGKVSLAVAANMPSTSDTEAATPAAVNAAIAANNTAMGASAAETIAGTEAAKFVSPDDMKAALQNNAVYPITVDATVTAGVTKINAITSTTLATVMYPTSTGRISIGPESNSSTGGAILGLFGAANTAGANAGGATLTHLVGAHIAFNGSDPSTADVRIDGKAYTKGNVFVGKQAYSGTVPGVIIEAGGGINVVSNAGQLALVHTATGVSTTFYANSTTTVGSIVVSGTATSYNTTSDYRLKSVDGPVTNSGAFIDALKPVTGEWNAEPGKKANFFLAHEVQEVSPTSVQGEKDAVDADGNPVMQSMEYGSADFIVNMIAELQDLRKRVAALEGAVL